jgi:hypothetical protein
MAVTVTEVCATQSQLMTLSPLDSVTVTSSQAQQTVVTFVNQVAGINMNNYNIASFNVSTSQVLGSQKQQTCISAVISNAQRSMGIAMILIEGKVRFYDLSLLSGTLEGAQLSIADSLSATKRAIGNYQAYFNASYCTGFDKIIPETIQAQNLTINDKDTTLNIQYFGDPVSQLEFAKLDWYQTNGLNVPAQSVQATVSKTGIITSFADNLGLYKVATTNVAISKEQAIQIATPYINAYTMQNNREIETINATLGYTTDFNGSRGDSYLIYPQWEISAIFEGSNSDVYGYNVLVWADNGQVRHEGAQANYQTVSTSSTLDNTAMTIIAIIVIAPFVVGIAYIRSRSGNRWWKNRATFRIGSVLVMVAALSSLLMVQPCFAYPSTIFGSTYNVPQYEVDLQTTITNYISSCFQSAGLTTYNWHGSSTTANNFYIGAYDHGEAYSLVFHIGHGTNQGGYAIIDNSGNWVSSTNIYDNSVSQSYGHVKFALLWSCYQGNEIGGMPRAWLHTTSISSDGYFIPDTSCQEFIGFNGPAPYLDNEYDGQDQAGYCLLYGFYYYALTQGFNTHAALDASTQILWQVDFCNSIFYQGLPSGAHMVVYGQGNLYIVPGPTYLTVNCDPNQGYTQPTSKWYNYGTNAQVIAWQNSGYYFDHWLVDGSYTVYSNPITVTMTPNHTIEAVYTTTCLSLANSQCL